MASEAIATIETAALVIPARTVNPAEKYLEGLARGSKPAQRSALKEIGKLVMVEAGQAIPKTPDGRDDAGAILDAVPWANLRNEHLSRLRNTIVATYAPATAIRYVAALRRVMKEAWRLGCLTQEEYRRATDLDPIKGERVDAGKVVNRDDIKSLFAACVADASPLAVRDAAIIAVLHATGMRRAECSDLKLGDYDQGEGRLHIQHGKGDKARLVYLNAGAQSALERWLAVRGDQSGPLFLRFRPHTKMPTAEGITPQSIWLMLIARADQAGIARPKPHDFRRTLATELIEGNTDIFAVQSIMGHSSADTTRRYDKRGEKQKQLASLRRQTPFV